MLINEIHDFINDLLMKEQGGYQPHPTIDTALYRASMWKFRKLLPLYETNEQVETALAPFKSELSFATDINGLYTIPGGSNFQRLNGMGISFTDSTGAHTRGVSFVSDDEWEDAKNSQLRKPTITNPVVLRKGVGGFEFSHAAVYAGKVRFLRTPVAPKYNFTKTGRVVTYNPTGSVNLEWDEKEQNEVIIKSLEFLGLNLGEDRLIQVGEALSNASV